MLEGRFFTTELTTPILKMWKLKLREGKVMYTQFKSRAVRFQPLPLHQSRKVGPAGAGHRQWLVVCAGSLPGI